MLGTKIDLSKCCDGCDAMLSIHILGKLGCDVRVLKPVETLGCHRQVYFCNGGLATHHAAKHSSGVLKGCTFPIPLMAATVCMVPLFSQQHSRNSACFWTESEPTLSDVGQKKSEFDAAVGFLARARANYSKKTSDEPTGFGAGGPCWRTGQRSENA